MQYHCSICQQKVEDDLLVFIKHTEEHIVDEIKAKHPEWIESNGLCQKCIDYYKNEMKGKRG